jgi:hypothetical protein
VTSTLEGNHGTLKNYLQSSTGHLKDVVDKLLKFWENQDDQYWISLGQQRRVSTSQVATNPLFGKVKGFVHENVLLDWVIPEVQKLPRDLRHYELPPCTCQITSCAGVPCKCKILHRLQAKEPLHPLDFHEHWWYHRPKPGDAPGSMHVRANEVLDPDWVPGKGRHKGSKNKPKSGAVGRGSTLQTRRDPSGFEYPNPTPPSTAPVPAGVVIILRSTANFTPSAPSRAPASEPTPTTTDLALARLAERERAGLLDPYRPGTQMPRSSERQRGGPSVLEQPSVLDSNADTDDEQSCSEDVFADWPVGTMASADSQSKSKGKGKVKEEGDNEGFIDIDEFDEGGQRNPVVVASDSPGDSDDDWEITGSGPAPMEHGPLLISPKSQRVASQAIEPVPFAGLVPDAPSLKRTLPQEQESDGDDELPLLGGKAFHGVRESQITSQDAEHESYDMEAWHAMFDDNNL